MLMSACSTDLEVIGDYKETMIIYGLLDKGMDTQYVKINKAFLGEGDAFIYAQVKDSVQFVNALTVEIQRFKNGSPVGSAIPLFPKNMPKDPGLFYSSDQANAIYAFSTQDYPLFTDSEYELKVTNSETGTTAKAKTELVRNISSYISPSTGSTFSFVTTGSVPNYPFNMAWNAADYARLYQVTLRLNYVDSTTTGGNSAVKSVDYVLPIIHVDNINSTEYLEQRMKGKDFFQFIGNFLTDYSGLEKRTAVNVQLMLASGSDQLSIFIDVNKPSTGIIQEKPEYTNITNGLGLFTSRYNRSDARPLDNTSWDSLACGQYTKHLKFVDFFGAHPCF